MKKKLQITVIAMSASIMLLHLKIEFVNMSENFELLGKEKYITLPLFWDLKK